MTPLAGPDRRFHGAVGAVRIPQAPPTASLVSWTTGTAIAFLIQSVFRPASACAARALHKPNDLGFPGALIPDQDVLTRAQLLVNELVQDNRAVDDVRLGQARLVMKSP